MEAAPTAAWKSPDVGDFPRPRQNWARCSSMETMNVGSWLEWTKVLLAVIAVCGVFTGVVVFIFLVIAIVLRFAVRVRQQAVTLTGGSANADYRLGAFPFSD